MSDDATTALDGLIELVDKIKVERAKLSQRDTIGLVPLRKLIRDTAATEDADGWSVDIDDETAERIALAVLAYFGAVQP